MMHRYVKGAWTALLLAYVLYLIALIWVERKGDLQGIDWGGENCFKSVHAF